MPSTGGRHVNTIPLPLEVAVTLDACLGDGAGVAGRAIVKTNAVPAF